MNPSTMRRWSSALTPRRRRLLGDAQRAVGDLAPQGDLRFLDLLLDHERGLLADALGALLGGGDQLRLLDLGLGLDPGAHVGDLALQAREPLFLLAQPRLGLRARLRRGRDLGLELLVARGQRLVDRAAAELDQDRQQHAEVQQLQRQLLAVDRRRLLGVLAAGLVVVFAFGGRCRRARPGARRPARGARPRRPDQQPDAEERR